MSTTPPPSPAPGEQLMLIATPSAGRSPEEFVASFEVSSVPASPGCYLMYDERERIVYVGKAKNLRSRLRTYLNDQDSRYTVKFLMKRVAHIGFLITSNEKEALFLENSLIKQHKPRYNVQLKDDKSYVSLRIDANEDFPRLTVTRRLRKDGAHYFGPYASAHSVRDTVRQINRIFPLRTCTDHVMRNRTRPCIYYQMKQCVAPCVDYVSREEYHAIVDQVVMALAGRSQELEALLLEQIHERAGELKFEEAATLRDRLRGLHDMLERQRTVSVRGAEDRDVVGYYAHGRFIELQIMFYRGGKLLGGRSFSFKHRELPIGEVLSSFLLQYYSEAPSIPNEVLVPDAMEDADTLGEILSEQRGTKVAVQHAQRGEKRALVELAARNARSNFEEKQLAERAQDDLLAEVAAQLKLTKPPKRIECFDISTHQGDRTVGSMVVFENGEANKQRYRRYAIKRIDGQDDFGAMREVLMRRFTRAIAEADLPDLVLIDGGKGQLGVASAVMKDLAIEDLDLASIAKSRVQESGGHSPERFFRPGRANPIILPQNSPVVLLLARVRDEAHRFAITYHREKRRRGTIRTSLTDVPGVGPTIARRLLNKFGSIARIRGLSAAELAEVPGISAGLAERILGHVAQPPAPADSGDTP